MKFTLSWLKEHLDTSASLGLPRYESLQPEYNLVEREGFEAERQAIAREHELAVVPYAALASGSLRWLDLTTGDSRAEHPVPAGVTGVWLGPGVVVVAADSTLLALG